MPPGTPRQRFIRRRAFLKHLGALGIGAVAGLTLPQVTREIEALTIPSPERFIGPHPEYAADVVVFRSGDEAVAIDSRGRKLCSSDNHWKVMDKVFDELESIGGGVIRVRGAIEIDQYLVPRRNLLLVGVGDYSEGSDTFRGDVIRAKSPMEALFITDEYVENFRIIGLGLDGNNVAEKAFKHTAGYEIKLFMVDIARVTVKGVESVVSGGLYVVLSRISASKSATSPDVGIELRTDSLALFNTVRAFRTGIRATTAGNFIIGNHVHPHYGTMEYGFEIHGSLLALNYVDGYTKAGVRITGWGSQVIGNWITTLSGLGSGVDAPFIEIDLDSPGMIGDIVICGNIGSVRSGTTILYAIKFGDNVTDEIETYVYGNRFTGYSSLTNNERLLATAPFNIPVLSDCADLQSPSHDGEISVCYDTGTSTWRLKVAYGGSWHDVG